MSHVSLTTLDKRAVGQFEFFDADDSFPDIPSKNNLPVEFTVLVLF